MLFRIASGNSSPPSSAADASQVPSIDPGDDPPEDVAYSVQGETDILNVLGPYVAIEHRLTIDRGSFSSDDTIQSVIDLRTSKTAELNRLRVVPAAREATGLPSVTGRRWNNDELNPAFRSLTAGDFEVVQLGWR